MASWKKGRRRYNIFHGLKDYKVWIEDIQDRWKVEEETEQDIWDEWEMQEEREHIKMEEEEQAVPRSSPNLGDVVTHLLERLPKKKFKKRRRHKMSSKTDACFRCKTNTNPASSNPVKMRGKKAVIYEEKADTNDISYGKDTTSSGGIMVSMDAQLPDKDIRITSFVKLDSQTLIPCHLRVVFGDAYIESKSLPQRFAIDISPKIGIDGGDAYVLFEEVNDDNRDFLSVIEKFETLDWKTINVRYYALLLLYFQMLCVCVCQLYVYRGPCVHGKPKNVMEFE